MRDGSATPRIPRRGRPLRGDGSGPPRVHPLGRETRTTSFRSRKRAPGDFDAFLFADYSGAAAPGAQRRAIALWRADRGTKPRKISGPFTRDDLRHALLWHLVEATRRGRRVLFGIDHQWSWPRDLWRAAGLGRAPWRRSLAALVGGDRQRPPLGPPATFPAAFNAYAQAAIFHCRVGGLARRYSVPTRSDWSGDPVRLTERAMIGTKPATRLGGAGAVAGQTLEGLRQLHILLTKASAAGVPILAWPFDALADDGLSHVGVEVYPTFYRPASVPKTDDADARACCEWAATADLAQELNLGNAPDFVRRAARKEGWILGAKPPTRISGVRSSVKRQGSLE